MIEIVSYGRAVRGPSVHTASVPRPRRMAADAPRVDWVDCAKGICIVLVVMMHATLGVEAELGQQGFMHWAVDFAKPFRMPDFFVISGLFLSRVIDRDWRTYADRRILHFAYFYLLWFLIQSALKYSQLSNGSPSGFLLHLLTGLVEPFSTLWFIYALALFSVATKLLRGVSPPILLAAGAALQILPIQTGSFLVNEFCDHWIYFLGGYLLAPAIFRLAEGARSHPGPALAGLAAWAVVNGVLAFTVTDILGRATWAELPVVALLAGSAGACAIVVLSAVLSRSRLVAPIRYAGANSIVIYLTFFLPMAVVRMLLVRSGFDDAGWIAAIVTACAVVVPLVLERLVRGTTLDILYRRPRWARLSSPGAPLKLQPAG